VGEEITFEACGKASGSLVDLLFDGLRGDVSAFQFIGAWQLRENNDLASQLHFVPAVVWSLE
jgi:hypothetical protein